MSFFPIPSPQNQAVARGGNWHTTINTTECFEHCSKDGRGSFHLEYVGDEMHITTVLDGVEKKHVTQDVEVTRQIMQDLIKAWKQPHE